MLRVASPEGEEKEERHDEMIRWRGRNIKGVKEGRACIILGMTEQNVAPQRKQNLNARRVVLVLERLVGDVAWTTHHIG